MSEETKAIKESAKAAQEIAKTTGKVIGAGEKLGSFLARFICGPLEQGVGIVEDKLKYYRWERQQRLMKRAEEYMSKAGLKEPTKLIPLKLAVPLFQAASMEDDDYLQDMWARLLVNGTNISSGVDLKRVYIDILERLTSLETQILEQIYSLPFEEIRHNGVFTVDLPEVATIANDKEMHEAQQPNDEVKLALANLHRLGCISIARSWGGGELFSSVTPTLLGKSFVEACTLNVN